MHVGTIEMRGFMSHTNTALHLPQTGIVAVTGENGAGKSSLVEAVSYALWGETLRRASPWSGDKGSVRVLTDALEAVRTKTKSSKSLVWCLNGAEATVWETPTKAQEALCRVVGTFDVWRRSSVFSSADAAHFSLATDADRKRMLETVLGLERFDVASQACREDLRLAERAESMRRQEVATAQTAVKTAKATLDREKLARDEEGPALGDPDALDTQVTVLQKQLDAVENDRHFARIALGNTNKQLGEVQGAIAAIERALANIRDACPTCGGKLDTSKRPALEERLRAAREAAELKDAKTAAGAAHDALTELNEERDHVAAKLQATQQNARAARQQRVRRANIDARIDQAERHLASCQEAAQGVDVALAKAELETRTLRAADRALGTKGLRAHILGRALSGLEGVANAWLSRLAGRGYRLKVSAYTENKSGGVRDAISLNVEGMAHREGYAGCSAGERRRLDIALLLALGELSAAAHGQRPGTLFADELFDHIDEDGQRLVVETLREIAQERAVVVITHSKELVEALRPDVRWHVKAGGRVDVG